MSFHNQSSHSEEKSSSPGGANMSTGSSSSGRNGSNRLSDCDSPHRVQSSPSSSRDDSRTLILINDPNLSMDSSRNSNRTSQNHQYPDGMEIDLSTFSNLQHLFASSGPGRQHSSMVFSTGSRSKSPSTNSRTVSPSSAEVLVTPIRSRRSSRISSAAESPCSTSISQQQRKREHGGEPTPPVTMSESQSTANTNTNLSQLIQVWSSAHVSGATVSFSHPERSPATSTATTARNNDSSNSSSSSPSTINRDESRSTSTTTTTTSRVLFDSSSSDRSSSKTQSWESGENSGENSHCTEEEDQSQSTHSRSAATNRSNNNSKTSVSGSSRSSSTLHSNKSQESSQNKASSARDRPSSKSGSLTSLQSSRSSVSSSDRSQESFDDCNEESLTSSTDRSRSILKTSFHEGSSGYASARETPPRVKLDGSSSRRSQTLSPALNGSMPFRQGSLAVSPKSPYASKHVTFVGNSEAECRVSSDSMADATPSADSSSDPSRYENSSLMMTNSVVDSTMDGSIQNHSNVIDSSFNIQKGSPSRDVELRGSPLDGSFQNHSNDIDSSFNIRKGSPGRDVELRGGPLETTEQDDESSFQQVDVLRMESVDDVDRSTLTKSCDLVKPNVDAGLTFGATLEDKNVMNCIVENHGETAYPSTPTTAEKSRQALTNDFSLNVASTVSSTPIGPIGTVSSTIVTEYICSESNSGISSNVSGCGLNSHSVGGGRQTIEVGLSHRCVYLDDGSNSKDLPIEQEHVSIQGNPPPIVNGGPVEPIRLIHSPNKALFDASLDSSYFTPEPVLSNSVSFNVSLEHHHEGSMDVVDGLNSTPFSPQNLSPPDDLDLTSIHSEGSNSATSGNRHHLLSLSSSNKSVGNGLTRVVPEIFAVAATEPDEVPRTSWSFEVGISHEYNRSNDTERMLENVINAAQEAVSKRHVDSCDDKERQSLRQSILQVDSLVAFNVEDDHRQIGSRTKQKTPLRSNGHTDTNPLNRSSSEFELNILCDNNVKVLDPTVLSTAGGRCTKKSSTRATKLNDENSDSFEASSVSTLGNDSDKEEGEVHAHFWIDAFLDFVNPTEDDRSVNSYDSASTASESIGCARNDSAFTSENKKTARPKSKNKGHSSFSRLREWWKKELIAEVMRDTTNKSLKKSDGVKQPYQNVERLVSKEFKKVLSGEKVELLGSNDSCDGDALSSRNKNLKSDLPQQDWLGSFKETVVCGTSDTLKESYKTIQKEVESFDTLDGLVQALKKTKLETDPVALSGRFTSIYNRLQKGIQEATVLERYEEEASPNLEISRMSSALAPIQELSRTGCQTVEGAHLESNSSKTCVNSMLTPSIHSIQNDSLDLFLKDTNLDTPDGSPQRDLPEPSKRKSGRRSFQTPDNSLLERSLNETISTTSFILDAHVAAERRKQEDPPEDGTSTPNPEERPELSQSSLFPSGSEYPELSRSTLSPSFDMTWSEDRRTVDDIYGQCKLLKGSPDKRNETKDTVPDLSEVSIVSSKINFDQALDFDQSLPENPYAEVVDAKAPQRLRKRRPPKIHITTLSQQGRDDAGSKIEDVYVRRLSLSDDARLHEQDEINPFFDNTESNLTHFGEECQLPFENDGASNLDEQNGEVEVHDLPSIFSDSSFTVQDDEFDEIPAVADDVNQVNQVNVEALHPTVNGSSIASSCGTRSSKCHDVQALPSDKPTRDYRSLQRIGNVPLIKKRLEMKARLRAKTLLADSALNKVNTEPNEILSNLTTASSLSAYGVDEIRKSSVASVTISAVECASRASNDANPEHPPVVSLLDVDDVTLHTVTSAERIEKPCRIDDAIETSKSTRPDPGGIEPLEVAKYRLKATKMLIASAKQTGDERNEDKNTEFCPSSPDSTIPWEDFSSQSFGVNFFHQDDGSNEFRRNASTRISAGDFSDVYTKSQIEFTTFDQNVYAKSIL